MNSNYTNLMAFAFGATLGATVAWLYINRKYAQPVQEVTESVAEEVVIYQQEPVAQIQKQSKEKPNITEYVSTLRENGYTNYADMTPVSDNTKDEEEEEPMAVDKPYVISPDEFGDFDDYEQISLVYYADQILADDDDELVEDVDEVVGFESLGRFGEYEDDSVFVRNDRLKCDYEILMDRRRYSDVTRKKPQRQYLQDGVYE